MFGACSYQLCFAPIFWPRQSYSADIRSRTPDNSFRRASSFLSPAPALRINFNSRYPSENISSRGQCSSGIFATVSSTHKTPQEESPVFVICSIIHSSFEQAVVELMFPSRHNATFVRCYELVGAILYAKRNHISIKELEDELHSFTHPQPASSLPLMSELQRHTVRAFLAKIYDVDDLLETRNQIGITKYNPNVNPSRVEVNRLRRIMKGGRLVADVLQEICECNLGTLRDMISEKAPEVATRDSLPTRWANVLAVLTAYLREHISS